MTRDELIRFYRDYESLVSELRSAPYVAPDMSEDGAEDIAVWAVAQGKDFYQRIHRDPSAAPKDLPPDPQGLGFMSQIGNVYFDRFDEEVNDAAR